MKIKKAIEKARMSRESQHTPHEPQRSRPVIDSEWKAPVYTESRHVTPDMKVLEEHRCVCMSPDSPYMGAYKVLRTQLQKHAIGKGGNTLMVTSVLPGEGKTLTSINLALTFARAYDVTVMLLDCDLHRQDVHKYMGIQSTTGLVDYLVDDVPLKDLIMWPGIDKMTLISGGRIIKETTELLTSPRMQALVEEVKNRYQDRYVIFDVPPVLMGADAIAFAGLVDAVIMVVEANRTPMEDIKKALELIPQEKFLGFVMNKDNSRPDSYYSYYY